MNGPKKLQIGELIESNGTQAYQFTLVDVFAIITFASVLLAMFAPLIRWAAVGQMMQFVLALVIQLLAFTGTMAYALSQRRTTIEQAGRRFGIAFFGTAKWSGWLPIKSILLMVLLASIQLLIAFAFVGAKQSATDHWFMLMFNTAQISFLFAKIVVRFLWRVYPGTLEFFEHGVVSFGYLYPWRNVEVRESQFFTDRVAVVLRSRHGGISTCMTRVSEALGDEVKRRAIAS